MATVTTGLKDGIDEILEKSNSLERMLRARLTMASDLDDAKVDAINKAIADVASLKEHATATRASIQSVMRRRP